MIEFEAGDLVIHDGARGGYFCAQVGSNTDFDQLIQEISDHMEREQFWPNVFYINDHGNTDVLSIKRNGNGIATYETIESWV